MTIITAADRFKKYEAHRATIKHGKTWGQWVFDAKRLCLVWRDGEPRQYEVGGELEAGDYLVGGFSGYEVDLEEITTAGDLCDWVFQVHMHGYDPMGFLDAIFDLLNPQGTLCSGGSNKQKLDVKAYLKKEGVVR